MAGNGDAEEITQRIEPPRRGATRARTRVPDHEVAEVRDVDFPVGMRGYDRAAVDSYVSRVNRLIAELQISAAPESAIRHALDEVADETRGILERAHETADEITRRSRAKADDRLQQSEQEAEDVRTSADTYVREIRGVAERQLQALQADADRIWRERDGVVANLRELARQLDQIAAEAAERYPERPEVDTRATAAPPEPATGPPAPPEPAMGPPAPPEPATGPPLPPEPTRRPPMPPMDDEAEEPHPFADD
jgi:DivIVA domain-containing protein